MHIIGMELNLDVHPSRSQPQLKIAGDVAGAVPVKKKYVRHESAPRTTSQPSPVTQDGPRKSRCNLRSRRFKVKLNHWRKCVTELTLTPTATPGFIFELQANLM